MEFFHLWKIPKICKSEFEARQLRRILAKKLRERGFKIIFFRKGRIALKAEKSNNPLILVGYEKKHTDYYLWDNGSRIAFAPDWMWRELQRSQSKKVRYMSPKNELQKFQAKGGD